MMYMNRKGKLIVIEGLDGSGKATQTQLLEEMLRSSGKDVRRVSFPDYDSESSALVRMYLSGQFGSRPEAVNAYAASSFYAVDRYASYKRQWEDFYRDGGIVVADRYTTSNAIHQCSKLARNEWNDFLDWLFHYEYKLLGIPSPDMVIYLDVDPEVSQRLMERRYNMDESRKDIHERDLNYLERSHAAAGFCREKLGWTEVKCCVNGGMRTVEDIHREIVERLRTHLEKSLCSHYCG